MAAVSERFKARIERWGEVLGFTKLGGVAAAFSVRGVVAPLSGGSRSTFLDDVEAMGLERPGLQVLFAGDSGVVLNDTFVRDARAFTVLKAFSCRDINTEVVCIIGVCG